LKGLDRQPFHFKVEEAPSKADKTDSGLPWFNHGGWRSWSEMLGRRKSINARIFEVRYLRVG
jgi:hypothetical protein